MRNELFKEIVGEFRKLVLELELDSRGEKCRTLQQTADHGVNAVLYEASETLGDAGIFVGEFTCLLIKQLEFPIIEIEKFLVHERVTSDLYYFSRIDNVGDEFHRDMHRLASQIGAYNKPYL